MEATKKRAAKLQAKGQTVDFNDLLRLEPDSGTTNIRNVGSRVPQWTSVRTIKTGPETVDRFGFLTTAQRHRGADSSEGDAGDPDDDGRNRRLADGADD
jgi:hypothetical protein